MSLSTSNRLSISLSCLRRPRPAQRATISAAAASTRPLQAGLASSTHDSHNLRCFTSSRATLSAKIPTADMPSLQHERTIPAWFCRGGTSNGLIVTRADLPPESEWQPILSAAMGSPDGYVRQLNGMGSGISSTSKVIVLGPPTRDDVDVDYTFVQVGIKDGSLDKAGNCGNMSSLVGPMAWDKGMLSHERASSVLEEGENGEKWARVRLFNTNTNKVLESRFRVEGDPLRYCPRGDYAMDGVPSTGSMIRLSFLDPAGAKTGKALPTGRSTNKVTLPDGRMVEASLVDVSNPGVFVRAHDMLVLAGKTEQAAAESARFLTPAAIEADDSLKNVLEEVRQAGASMMGLDPMVQSVPKVVMLLPRDPEYQVDVKCLALSMGQAHKAVPLTLALCLGAACQMEDSIPCSMLPPAARGGERGYTEAADEATLTRTVTIGHASGKMDIVVNLRSGNIVSAELLRTARVLMKGEVLY